MQPHNNGLGLITCHTFPAAGDLSRNRSRTTMGACEGPARPQRCTLLGESGMHAPHCWPIDCVAGDRSRVGTGSGGMEDGAADMRRSSPCYYVVCFPVITLSMVKIRKPLATGLIGQVLNGQVSGSDSLCTAQASFANILFFQEFSRASLSCLNIMFLVSPGAFAPQLQCGAAQACH